MTDRQSFGRRVLAGLLVAASLCTPLAARAQLDIGRPADRSVRLAVPAGGPALRARTAATEPPMLVAGADCSAAASEAAAETGGQVLSVTSREQGGRTVCIVTVLVPGEDGARPRKRTIAIPQ